MPCFVVLVLSFIVGRLLDADHSRALMVTGTCLTTVGMFMLSVVNGDGGPGDGSYGLILLCQGVIQGFGMACFFVTSSQGESTLIDQTFDLQDHEAHRKSVVATWFGKRKSFAIGIVASGASICKFIIFDGTYEP